MGVSSSEPLATFEFERHSKSVASALPHHAMISTATALESRPAGAMTRPHLSQNRVEHIPTKLYAQCYISCSFGKLVLGFGSSIQRPRLVGYLFVWSNISRKCILVFGNRLEAMECSYIPIQTAGKVHSNSGFDMPTGRSKSSVLCDRYSDTKCI